MLRWAAVIILFCFLSVAFLGNGCGLLCLRISKAETPVVVDEPDRPACGSCCPSRGCGGEQKKSRNPRPEKPLCGSMDCPEPVSGKNDCDKCFMPRLDFTLVEKKNYTAMPAMSKAHDPGGKVEDRKQHRLRDNPRLWGVHPIISSTVLRI